MSNSTPFQPEPEPQPSALPPDAPRSGPPQYGPLTFGEILGRSFTLLKQNPVPLLAVTALIAFVALTIAGTISAIAQLGLEEATRSGPMNSEAIGAATLCFLGALLFELLVYFSVWIITQGIPILNLRSAYLGTRATTPQLWQQLRQHIWRLIQLCLVYAGISLGASILLALMVLAVVALAVGTGASDTAMLLVVLPTVLLMVAVALVPLVWLLTRLSLSSSVLICEGAPVRTAMARSWQLTRGRFWRVLGIQYLLAFIYSAIASILTGIALLAIMITVVAANPSFDTNPAGIGLILMLVVATIPFFALGAVTSVVTANATGFLYVDARLRTDWLWYSLNEHAAARASGVPAERLTDPFMAPPAAPPR